MNEIDIKLKRDEVLAYLQERLNLFDVLITKSRIDNIYTAIAMLLFIVCIFLSLQIAQIISAIVYMIFVVKRSVTLDTKLKVRSELQGALDILEILDSEKTGGKKVKKKKKYSLLERIWAKTKLLKMKKSYSQSKII